MQCFRQPERFKTLCKISPNPVCPNCSSELQNQGLWNILLKSASLMILMHTEVCKPDQGTEWFKMQMTAFSFPVFLVWGPTGRRMDFCLAPGFAEVHTELVGRRPFRRLWALPVLRPPCCPGWVTFLSLWLLLLFDLQLSRTHTS